MSNYFFITSYKTTMKVQLSCIKNSLLLVIKSTMKLKLSSFKYIFVTNFKVNNENTGSCVT